MALRLVEVAVTPTRLQIFGTGTVWVGGDSALSSRDFDATYVEGGPPLPTAPDGSGNGIHILADYPPVDVPSNATAPGYDSGFGVLGCHYGPRMEARQVTAGDGGSTVVNAWVWHDNTYQGSIAGHPFHLSEGWKVSEDVDQRASVSFGGSSQLGWIREGSLQLGITLGADADGRVQLTWLELVVRYELPGAVAAYNRAFQRGCDGLGVTGGRRAFGGTSQQGSNRAVGFR